jgi:hypothetical protein
MVVTSSHRLYKEHPKGVAMAVVTIVDGDLLND